MRQRSSVLFTEKEYGKGQSKYDIISVCFNFLLTILFSRIKTQNLCCMPQLWPQNIYILTGLYRLFNIMVGL